MVRNVGEVAIRCAVWFKDGNPIKTGGLQKFIDRRFSHTMQRRKDGFQIATSREAQLEHRINVRIVDCFADNFDSSIGDRFVEIRGRYVGRFVDFLHDALVVRSDDLAAVIPVSLESVIGWRIVRGGNHDADVAVQMSHGE